MQLSKVENIHHFRGYGASIDGEYDIPLIYVVTYPYSMDSVLDDIFFETNLFSFCLQLKGGLTAPEICLITYKYSDAKKMAESLLKNRNFV
jgi:hypothetical protein